MPNCSLPISAKLSVILTLFYRLLLFFIHGEFYEVFCVKASQGSVRSLVI